LTVDNAEVNVSAVSSNTKQAVPFWLNGTVDAVELRLFRTGAIDPGTRFLRVEIQTTSGSNPSGTVLGSADVDYSLIPEGSANRAWIHLAMSVPLEQTQKYWLVAYRSDGNVGTDSYVSWGTTISPPNPYHYDTAAKVWSGSVWNPGFPDICLRVFTSEGARPAAVVHPVICDGEAVAPGTKTISIGSIQNPVIADTTFTVGDDVGAAGTYPTAWRWHKTTAYDFIPNNSNVALCPELKLKKTDTGTRFVLVCAAGMLFEYGPQAAPG
jgi:hypothetical protein